MIVGIFLLRKTHRFGTSFGLSALVVLYLFSIIRIALPLEPPHVIELGIGEVYPQIYRFLTTYHIYGNYLHFSYLSVLILIWIIGTCILLIRFMFSYHKALHIIIKYAFPCGSYEYGLLTTVKKEFDRSMDISLYTIPNIDIPFGIGIFRKSILLPQNDYTDRELYYILLHEYSHFLNQDIKVKVMVSIFCCIFWWNPIVYLLKVDLEQALEMKCDVTVAGHLDNQGKVAYLRTIVGVIKQCSSAKPAVPYTSTALLPTDRMLDIKERFDVVLHCGTGRCRTLSQIFLSVVVACVIVLSYIVVPQPAFSAPLSIEPNTVDFNSSNSYVLQDKSRNYWLVIDSQEPTQIPVNLAEFFQQTGLSIIKE